jgi:putative colanic acid biosynthesis glycosyltransferase
MSSLVMQNKILISIVTVVYNGEEFLEKTIQSVLSQTYNNIEYIIIDGGSTDRTVDIIRKYEDKISIWISETDKGIYDAMNKGAKLANGDFINFMNADDIILTNDAIEKLVNKITKLDNLYYTRASVVSDSVCWIYPDYSVKDYRKWLSLNLPNHQTMFFPKNFYKNNFYDLKLRIGADDDYKLFALKKCDVEFIDIQFVEFQRGGVSSDHKSFVLFKQRVYESFVRNYKHKRFFRLCIDPLKLMLMFSIYNFFGEKVFHKFIKIIVKLKG